MVSAPSHLHPSTTTNASQTPSLESTASEVQDICDDGTAYLVQALAGLRISRRSAEVLVQALSLIAEEQSFFYPVVGAEDDISCDTSGTALDGLSRQEAHPTIATTSPVTSPSSLTGRSIAPTLPGRAILSGPSAPSVILAPPPPPAPQQWYRVYRGYVYNYPMPTELNRGGPFYCVTKGLRVGIFADWQVTADLTQGISRCAQSKFSTLQKSIAVFEKALERGAVEILVGTVPSDE